MQDSPKRGIGEARRRIAAAESEARRRIAAAESEARRRIAAAESEADLKVAAADNRTKRKVVAAENRAKLKAASAEYLAGRQAATIERERALWKSPSTEKRLERGDPALMHRLEILDSILEDRASLRHWTGLAPEEFKILLGRVVAEIGRAGGAPLFRDSAADASARGNRCKLEYRHAVQLALVHRKTSLTQGQLASMFGVDQSSVCRYLKLCGPALEKARGALKKR